MEISTKQILVGILPAGYFLWTTDFTGGCIILFLLLIIDTITGIRAAQKNGTFSSTIATARTKTINGLS